MTPRQVGWFRCPACQQVFAWKPQLAQRPVRCKCGHGFVVRGREAEVDADVLPSDALVEIGPPRPAVAARVSGTRTVKDPFDQPPSVPRFEPTRGIPSNLDFHARVSRRRPVAQDTVPEDGSRLKRRGLPIALIVTGLLIHVVSLLLLNDSPGNKWGGQIATPQTIGTALILAFCQVIIWTGLLIAGATVAAKLMGISFGSVGSAALKLCGIATFTYGVASVVASLDRGASSVTGMIIALHVMMLCYWVLFSYLFSMEIMETLMTAAIIMLIQSAAVCGVWKSQT